MREIKFRAWNGNCIIGASSVRANGSFALRDGLSDKDLLVIPTPKYEIMQYTGLKDKNNVEIFEGDIVTHEDFNLPSEVTFERGCFRIHGFTIANFEAIHHMGKIQVIGNIYETPELLN